MYINLPLVEEGDLECPWNNTNIIKEDDTLLVTISGGAAQRISEKKTVKEFSGIATEYLKRNSAGDDEVIHFLHNSMISDVKVATLAAHFVSLLSNRRGFRAVVTEYEDEKFLRLLDKFKDYSDFQSVISP